MNCNNCVISSHTSSSFLILSMTFVRNLFRVHVLFTIKRGPTQLFSLLPFAPKETLMHHYSAGYHLTGRASLMKVSNLSKAVCTVTVQQHMHWTFMEPDHALYAPVFIFFFSTPCSMCGPLRTYNVQISQIDWNRIWWFDARRKTA